MVAGVFCPKLPLYGEISRFLSLAYPSSLFGLYIRGAFVVFFFFFTLRVHHMCILDLEEFREFSKINNYEHSR
jgi:hypothetical protein